MVDIKFNRERMLDVIKSDPKLLDAVKEFFADPTISDLLEERNFQEIYSIARARIYETYNIITASLLLSDINPLENMEQILYGTFANLPIESITIPNTVKEIRSAAFGGCYILRDVKIPTTVMYLTPYAFAGCGELKEITYEGTVAQWKEITSFSGDSWLFIKVICADGYVQV